jgi:hypothetical protein
VAAVVEPAVAVTATGAIADALADAEALPPDDCARADDAASITIAATAASIMPAARGDDSFLLDSTSHSSFSSVAPSSIATVTGALPWTHRPNELDCVKMVNGRDFRLPCS